jgi:CRISPR-associated protein Cas1
MNTQTLLLSDFGTFCGKRSERVVVRKSDGSEEEFPLFRVQEIIIAKQGVSISSDLIDEAVQRGIKLTFIDGTGRPYAMLTSPYLSAPAVTRRAQITAFHNEIGVRLARTVVAGKLANQANLLKYLAKNLPEAESESRNKIISHAETIHSVRHKARLVDAEKIDECRDTLMGLEGTAGREYWAAIELLLGSEVFKGREHRGATDAVNAMLNYGYGILYAKVWAALLSAGLEPFAGFLHVDRPGKPSLVLDFVEEFRQPVVDRTVFAILNLGIKIEMENNLLSAEARRVVAKRVLERLNTEAEYAGQKLQLASIIQAQARRLALFFRGEKAYRCFRFKW